MNSGARQFVENHFADTTIGRIRLLVDATFRRERHLVEYNSQVRHSVEIVKSLFFDHRGAYISGHVLIFASNHLMNSYMSLHKYLCINNYIQSFNEFIDELT